MAERDDENKLDLGEVKYGRDKRLEELANKLLSGSVGSNDRSVERDVEKARYERGIIARDELADYNPDNDWDTQDSVYTLLFGPGDLEGVEPTICADSNDGNIRARNPRLQDRHALMHSVADTDSWGPAEEDIPLLGANERRKKCGKCGEPKGVELFSPDGGRKDGLRSWCKECEKKSSKTRRTVKWDNSR